MHPARQELQSAQNQIHLALQGRQSMHKCIILLPRSAGARQNDDTYCSAGALEHVKSIHPAPQERRSVHKCKHPAQCLVGPDPKWTSCTVPCGTNGKCMHRTRCLAGTLSKCTHPARDLAGPMRITLRDQRTNGHVLHSALRDRLKIHTSYAMPCGINVNRTSFIELCGSNAKISCAVPCATNAKMYTSCAVPCRTNVKMRYPAQFLVR